MLFFSTHSIFTVSLSQIMFVGRIHVRLCYLSTHQFISVRPVINVLHYRPQLCSENVALKRPHVFPIFIVKLFYCHSHFKPLYTVVLVFYVCVFLFFTPLSLCLHFATISFSFIQTVLAGVVVTMFVIDLRSAGLLCCNFFDMLTPVPFYHFFSFLILLFIYV